MLPHAWLGVMDLPNSLRIAFLTGYILYPLQRRKFPHGMRYLVFVNDLGFRSLSTLYYIFLRCQGKNRILISPRINSGGLMDATDKKKQAHLRLLIIKKIPPTGVEPVRYLILSQAPMPIRVRGLKKYSRRDLNPKYQIRNLVLYPVRL